MEKILAPLFKNTPLALVVIGLLLIVIGAAGGIEKLDLVIDNPGWRILITGMGAVVASFAALLIWRESGGEARVPDARQYGIEITATGTVGRRVNLEGRYRKKPPEDIVVIIERNNRTGDHYLQHAPNFDPKLPKWHGQYGIGSGERTLTIALMGKCAKSMKNYYDLVGTQTKWQGIRDLPSDFVRCDSVDVKGE
jgi:hypothetical protein